MAADAEVGCGQINPAISSKHRHIPLISLGLDNALRVLAFLTSDQGAALSTTPVKRSVLATGPLHFVRPSIGSAAQQHFHKTRPALHVLFTPSYLLTNSSTPIAQCRPQHIHRLLVLSLTTTPTALPTYTTTSFKFSLAGAAAKPSTSHLRPHMRK